METKGCKKRASVSNNRLVWFIIPFLVAFGVIAFLGWKTDHSTWAFSLDKTFLTNTLVQWEGGDGGADGEQSKEFESHVSSSLTLFRLKLNVFYG